MSSSMSGSGGYQSQNPMKNSTGMSGNSTPGGYQQGQLQQFTPEMLQLFQQLFQHVSPDSFLSKLAGGDQSMFEQVEAPAMKQFQELQGQNSSRFSGMGMGSRRGSGFNNSMSQATSDFAQSLQSQRMGLQNQAIKDLGSMSQMLLGQKPYENFMVEKKPDFMQQIAGNLASSLPGAVASFASGGIM